MTGRPGDWRNGSWKRHLFTMGELEQEGRGLRVQPQLGTRGSGDLSVLRLWALSVAMNDCESIVSIVLMVTGKFLQVGQLTYAELENGENRFFMTNAPKDRVS